MEKLTFLKAGAALMAALVIATPALAQRREHERFHTPHMVFDDRFHHNHYYPVPGYAVAVLPGGAVSLAFRGGRYFYHSGVWFTAGGPGYVVARPPVGIVVPALPPGYTTVWVAGRPYYYANDVYYISQPAGYEVAQPPMDATAAPAPAPGAPAPVAQSPSAPGPTPGTWYYCDASKAYYPYVSECAAGWRSVPAAPPPSR